MKEQITIKFEPCLVKRLNVAVADASLAVAEAALSAYAQDSKFTVRTFSTALRACAPLLGTSTQVLSAAVKAAKEKNASLEDVTSAMAAAADKKRRDDARRAAEKREAAPGKALEKAQAEVAECILAMRSPLQKAQDNLREAEEAVEAAAEALRVARAKQREALKTLKDLQEAEGGEGGEQGEEGEG